jgi:hypothetical protein|tara:strand:+ start:3530 stop:4327 length:798 start_codon:yes stop_codon:yes gene_type:complete
LQVFHSIRLAFLASFAGWLIQCPVSAAEPDSQPIPTYSVVVQDIDYYPIYKADLASNEYSGYLRDLMDAFAAAEAIRFEYKVRPVRRMIWEYTRGLYDFALPDHPNWNKSEKLGMELSYSPPLLHFADGLYVLRENAGITREQMADYGTIHGFTPWKFQNRIDQGDVELITASSPENLVLMALAGRVEVINLAAPVAEYHFRNLDATGRFETAAHLLPVSLSSYHLSSARHPDIINALADFLEQNPEIPRQLQEKYRFPALPSGD